MSVKSVDIGREEHRLTAWIIRHELVLFFTLAYLFSWSIYAVLPLVSIENDTTLSRTLLVAAFGPSLSAILLSVISTRQLAPKPMFTRLLVFIPILLLVFGSEWLDHIWWEHWVDGSLLFADFVLVILAAVVVMFLVTGFNFSPGASRQNADLRKNLVGIVIALGLWPLLVLIGNSIAGFFGMVLPTPPATPQIPLYDLLPETFIWAMFFGGPIAEEPGWRGFALPRLQKLFSPLGASVILGFLWGLWHLPLHLMGMYYGGALGAIIRIQEIPRAILFTWLYNRTKGNLLVVILFHASINTTGFLMARSYPIVLALLTFLAVLVIIEDKMWRKLN